MPNISELKKSNFLKKEDVGEGARLTITRVVEHNVAMDGAEQEMRWCVEFHGVDKPMVLNITNGEAIAKIAGSQNTDNWGGVVVVAYNDPNVSFAGKVTGGIRIRAPKGATTAPAPVAPKVGIVEENPLPF